MKKTNYKLNRIRILEKGKISSLGPFEKLSLKFEGWSDGRKGLIRKDDSNQWNSMRLKAEIDASEEFSAKLFGLLKVQEEEKYEKIGILFDRLLLFQKQLHDANNSLQSELNIETDFNERRVGEEKLTSAQIVERRTREREKHLEPFKRKVEDSRNVIVDTLDGMFSLLSQIQESFDSTCRIVDRLQERSERRLDVYLRAAMKQKKELPAILDVQFKQTSKLTANEHYMQFTEKAERLRNSIENEIGVLIKGGNENEENS